MVTPQWMHSTVSDPLIAVTLFDGMGLCAGDGARSIGRVRIGHEELSPSIEDEAALNAESSSLSLSLCEPKSARASGMHTSKTAAPAMYAIRWCGEFRSLSK